GKAVTLDRTDFLERLLGILSERSIPYCIIGGQAVNAYAEPVVSLDLDVVVAVDRMADTIKALSESFTVERFPHSLNVSAKGSDLRVQLQTDPSYASFVGRARPGVVLGIEVPVAHIDDVLQGKIWAAQDPERRPSKRLKDLADIARLLESHPELRSRVPADILTRLV